MSRLKLSSPSTVRKLLKEHGIRPRKRWGQHFLCDENILEKMVKAAQLQPKDRVLEIGAGLGTLTQHLAPHVHEVIAVEIDPRLIPILHEQLADFTNVKIVQADVLQLDWRALLEGKKAKALGNLPYVITSPLLEKLIQHRDVFQQAVLMVQLEVAEKLTAPVGTRGSSPLGVFMQAFCEVERVARVSKNVFFPRPEVDSALLRFVFLTRPRFRASEESFMAVVRAAFGMRRKTLRQALALSPDLKLSPEQARGLLRQAGIEEARRGETLTIEEFDRLAQALDKLRKSSV